MASFREQDGAGRERAASVAEPPGATPFAGANGAAPDSVAPDTPAETPPPDAKKKRFGFARELVETILLTLVIFFAVRTLIVNYRVDGSSMQPSLQNGQYLFVNKAVYFHFDLNALRNALPGEDREGRDVVYLFHPPERGDIVILDPPVPSTEPLVKRVIALPGETVAVRDGQVFVNGAPIEEGYIADPPRYQYPAFGGEGAEFTVPAGTVFVLGDNRNNSRDSHAFGPVPLDNIIGKAIVTYWPLRDFGLIPHERYAQAGNGR